jgi:hypothetical protein
MYLRQQWSRLARTDHGIRSKEKIINVDFALAYRRPVDENLAHE